MLQTRKLRHILSYKANLVTFFRLFLLFVSVLIFPYCYLQACFLLMVNVILDYLDGIVARRNNQCSFFGSCIDWLADISASIVMYLWWYALQPHLIILFLIFIVAELAFMIFDIIAKATHFLPVVKADEWTNYILKFTMEPGKSGYCCKGLGYFNMINYYLCGLSRILYFMTESQFWWWSFLINLIPALTYGLMNTAYTINILNCWAQRSNKDRNVIQVVFKEQ